MNKIKKDEVVEAPIGIDTLTVKETAIVKKLEQGSSNKEIAAQLFISEGTLKWHLHNIYSKLQVKNRTTAVVMARQKGYL